MVWVWPCLSQVLVCQVIQSKLILVINNICKCGLNQHQMQLYLLDLVKKFVLSICVQANVHMVHHVDSTILETGKWPRQQHLHVVRAVV